MGDQKYMSAKSCFQLANIYKNKGGLGDVTREYAEITADQDKPAFVYDCPLQLHRGLTLSMYLYLKDGGMSQRRQFIKVVFMNPNMELGFDIQTIFKGANYETSKLIVTNDGEPLFEGNIAYTLNNFGYLALVFERDENDADAEFKVTLYTLTGATLATFPVPQVKQLPELKKLTVGNLAIGDRISVLQLHKRPFNHEDIGELVCSTVKDRACVVSDFKEVGWIAKNYPVPDSLVAYYPLWEHTNTWYNKDPWEIQRDLKLNGHTLVDVGWKNDSSRPMFISSLPDNDKMAEITVPAANEFVLAFFFNHPVGPDSFSSVLFDMEGFGELHYEYTVSESYQMEIRFSINVQVISGSTIPISFTSTSHFFFPTSFIYVTKSVERDSVCVGIENPFYAKFNNTDSLPLKFQKQFCHESVGFSSTNNMAGGKPVKLVLNPTPGSIIFSLKYHNSLLTDEDIQKILEYDNSIIPRGEGFPAGIESDPSLGQTDIENASDSGSYHTVNMFLFVFLATFLSTL